MGVLALLLLVVVLLVVVLLLLLLLLLLVVVLAEGMGKEAVEGEGVGGHLQAVHQVLHLGERREGGRRGGREEWDKMSG
jgi:hypothetical protein